MREYLAERFGITGLICKAVATFGNSFFYMGILWYMLTDPVSGTLLVGMISFLEGAMKFIGIPLGAFIEYHNKRTLLIISCVGMIFVQAVYAVVVGFRANMFLCVFLYIFHEIFQNIHFSSMYVYSVKMLGKEKFQGFNAKLVIVGTLVQLLGSVSAAFFFAWKGFMGFVLFDLGCYLVLMLIILLFFKDTDPSWALERSETEKNHPLRESLEGVRYIFSVKSLLVTVVSIMVVNVFMLPFVGVTLPLRLREWLPGSYTFFFGFVSAAFMIGMIAGSVYMIKRSSTINGNYFKLVCGILFGVGITLAVLFNLNIWLTIGLAVIGGVGLSVVNITTGNAITLLTPENKLSRVNGATTFLGQALEPLGSVLATSICGTAGSLTATVVAGSSVSVIAVVIAFACIKLKLKNLYELIPEEAHLGKENQQSG